MWKFTSSMVPLCLWEWRNINHPTHGWWVIPLFKGTKGVNVAVWHFKHDCSHVSISIPFCLNEQCHFMSLTLTDSESNLPANCEIYTCPTALKKRGGYRDLPEFIVPRCSLELCRCWSACFKGYTCFLSVLLINISTKLFCLVLLLPYMHRIGDTRIRQEGLRPEILQCCRFMGSWRVHDAVKFTVLPNVRWMERFSPAIERWMPLEFFLLRWQTDSRFDTLREAFFT